LVTALTPQSKESPLLMCHGTADTVVRFEWGKKSFDLLKSGT
jgi:predicted esterase